MASDDSTRLPSNRSHEGWCLLDQPAQRDSSYLFSIMSPYSVGRTSIVSAPREELNHAAMMFFDC